MFNHFLGRCNLGVNRPGAKQKSKPQQTEPILHNMDIIVEQPKAILSEESVDLKVIEEPGTATTYPQES